MEILINNLRKQVAMLKKRLDALEEEYEKKEQEMREAKKEADTAKKNVSRKNSFLLFRGCFQFFLSLRLYLCGYGC